jgi:dipeptidase
MRLKKLLLLSGILFAALALAGAGLFFMPRVEQNQSFLSELDEQNCTVIMVGKGASADGSTMTTHTCDCGMCDWTWRHVPAADYKLGSLRKIYHISQYKTWPLQEGLKWDLYLNDYTKVDIPQVPHTYAYHHGMFGYMNENQVAISESTIGCQRNMRNPTPAPAFDLTMLTLVAMERAKTAREAIKVMGSLAEQYGYGFNDDGEMLAVSDPDEVWVFEIMPVGPLWTPNSGKPGAVWCAQRVPDDEVSICPNESRIGEIDVNNLDYFMASPNAVSYAVESGYYDPASGKPFSWKKAYSPREGSANSNPGRARMWRFYDLVAPSKKFSPDMQNLDYPFSVKPDNKISVQDVMNFTRDKCQDSHLDPLRGIRGGPFSNPNYYRGTRCIGTNRAEYTSLVQCRGWLPSPIGGIDWIAFGAQDTACYIPLYAGITKIPDSFSIGDHWILDRKSARWACDYVDFHTQVIYSYAIEDVKKAQAEWEGGAVTRVADIDKKAQELYQKDKAKAIKFLTDYCLSNADNVIRAWWNLGDQLLVKYNHFGFYDTEKRATQRRMPVYPDSWTKAVKMFDVLTEPPQK